MNPDQNTEAMTRRPAPPVKLIEVPRDQLMTLIQEAALADKYREDLIEAMRGLRDAAVETTRYQERNEKLGKQLQEQAIELARWRGDPGVVPLKRKYRRRKRRA